MIFIRLHFKGDPFFLNLDHIVSFSASLQGGTNIVTSIAGRCDLYADESPDEIKKKLSGVFQECVII